MSVATVGDSAGIAVIGSRLSLAAVAEYGERVGEAYEIYDADTGAADVLTLVNKLGGTVQVRDGDESLAIRSQGKFAIYLSSHTSYRRDRFTIAHELGHYFLHYRYLQERHHADDAGAAGLPEPVQVFNRGARNRTETEANWFASALLMPEKRFRETWNACGKDPDRVARLLEVSPNAARVRAAVLSLDVD